MTVSHLGLFSLLFETIKLEGNLHFAGDKFLRGIQNYISQDFEDHHHSTSNCGKTSLK